MKVDYEREIPEWTQATAKDLGATWREIVGKERPTWVSQLIAPRLHPKADDHIVWMLTSDQATLLIQLLRKGSTE